MAGLATSVDTLVSNFSKDSAAFVSVGTTLELSDLTRTGYSVDPPNVMTGWRNASTYFSRSVLPKRANQVPEYSHQNEWVGHTHDRHLPPSVRRCVA